MRKIENNLLYEKMTKKKPKTAAKLMAELEVDPEYQAQQQAQEAELSRLKEICAQDEAELVAEIRAVSCVVESVWDLVNNNPHPFIERCFVGSYPTAYPVLIKHLSLPHHERVREGIIRALTIKDGGLGLEKALFTQFEMERNPKLRWVLANALKTAVPYHRRKKHPEVAEVYRNGGCSQQ